MPIERGRVNDRKDYSFLGLGEIVIAYQTRIVQGNRFTARLAGCDTSKKVERDGLKGVCIIGTKRPESATHYGLGQRRLEEELYERVRVSNSEDIIPIIFLKQTDQS